MVWVMPILDRIEESAFIVADVTTLNLNVVYEIAFAIGQRKRAYLIRHRGSASDEAVAREVGIFDTLESLTDRFMLQMGQVLRCERKLPLSPKRVFAETMVH